MKRDINKNTPDRRHNAFLILQSYCNTLLREINDKTIRLRSSRGFLRSLKKLLSGRFVLFSILSSI